MPKRKKYPKLPNGYGSIKYLGKGRRNPFAVHPPTTEFTVNGVPKTPKALCYVDSWERGFAVLNAYHSGAYYKGYENTVPTMQTIDRAFGELSVSILAEFNRAKGIEKGKIFAEVYAEYYFDKFDRPNGKEYSQQYRYSITAAYKKIEPLYNREFKEIRYEELQDLMDDMECGYSTQENIVLLIKQMYTYAVLHDICAKDYSTALRISIEDDEEHGEPFTDQDLVTLWEHESDSVAEFLLIMCYSGYRISAYRKMKVDLANLSFTGGVKTKNAKNRTVPMHSVIVELVKRRIERDGALLTVTPGAFRSMMYEYLEEIGIERHTPHDCRHTFSKLCESYGVRENDRKRMLGHKVGDITNDVYGHRTLEELREEIEKIRKPKNVLLTCD